MNQPNEHDLLQITVASGKRNIAARSRCYQLFGVAFSYPWEGEIPDGLMNGDWQEAFQAAAVQLPYPLASFTGLGANIDFPPKSAEDLQVLYSKLFDGLGGKTAISISMYEKDYVLEAREKLWEDLLRFYKHFGLDFKGGKAMEPPDHLLMQLDYLHYLTFLEAGATGGTGSYIAAEFDFLERHLGEWVLLFVEKVRNAESCGPYVALATMLEEFVAADRHYLHRQVKDVLQNNGGRSCCCRIDGDWSE